MTPAFHFLWDVHQYGLGNGWSRKILVSDVTYVVGVEKDRMVRIPYKPRGKNIGWTWYGFVRTEQGVRIWGGAVNKSVGARGLAKFAGLLK